MTKKLLYDLPCVLFENYLKEFPGVTVNSGWFWLGGHYTNVLCKFFTIPSGSDEEKPTIFLLDNRQEAHKGFSESNTSVELMVLSKPPSVPFYISETLPIGSIYAKCTSSGGVIEVNDTSGFKFWISSGMSPYGGMVKFSFIYSKLANLHFFELSKRAQQMLVDPKYRWINHYFKSGEGTLPLEVNSKEILTNKFLKI